MIFSRLRPALLPAMALAGVLAPVRFSTTQAVAASTAECTTCCSRPGTACVVCATTCTTVESAYDNGGGKCPVQET
ncbi:MAG TPA: hypothetical protein VGX50_04475 [Longimicrobium sp.]|jgi:hypothetical protein|nr:hypothetical protein [Longimicrobium sp.]